MEYILKTKRIKKKTKHWREAKEMKGKFISSEQIRSNTHFCEGKL